MTLNFESIEYLKDGNEKQQRAYESLTSHSVLEILKDFDPRLVGTIPIDIDIDTSDLDIVCCWENKNLFLETLIENFADQRAFILAEKKIRTRETILANFQLDGFGIEIFGQNRSTKEQEGYRHMIVEYNILRSRDENFRQQIRDLKRAGLTTEEAFAKQLHLTGDPYQELLTFGGYA
jgi:hypothetical protein